MPNPAVTFLRSLSAHDDGFVCGWHGLTGCYPQGKTAQYAQAWAIGFAFGQEMRARYGC